VVSPGQSCHLDVVTLATGCAEVLMVMMQSLIQAQMETPGSQAQPTLSSRSVITETLLFAADQGLFQPS
jgi:hypothetical protein